MHILHSKSTQKMRIYLFEKTILFFSYIERHNVLQVGGGIHKLYPLNMGTVYANFVKIQWIGK